MKPAYTKTDIGNDAVRAHANAAWRRYWRERTERQRAIDEGRPIPPMPRKPREA